MENWIEIGKRYMELYQIGRITKAEYETGMVKTFEALLTEHPGIVEQMRQRIEKKI